MSTTKDPQQKKAPVIQINQEVLHNNVSFHSKCKVLGQRSDTVQQFREPGQRSVPRFF